MPARSLSPQEAIRRDPTITVKDFIDQHRLGRILRELDDYRAIADRPLADVWREADSKTRKLLSDGRWRKQN